MSSLVFKVRQTLSGQLWEFSVYITVEGDVADGITALSEKGILGMSIMQLETAETQTTISPFFRPVASRDQYQGQTAKAITRGVSQNLASCELTYRTREEIDHEKAASQLDRYCELLRGWDVGLLTIPGSDSYPDCCFVQDTAIVLDEVCVIASMGASARRGEVSEVERVVSQFRKVRHIFLPATLDGGDVVQIGKRLFVGLSSRTNGRGIEALSRIVDPLGYIVVPVSVRGSLHLTTGCGVVNDETVLLNPRWLDASAFRGLRQLHVTEEEPWAANTIRVDSAVCLEEKAPRTVDLVQPYAGTIETLDISEFRKAEGSLSCLSIIFRDAVQD